MRDGTKVNKKQERVRGEEKKTREGKVRRKVKVYVKEKEDGRRTSNRESERSENSAGRAVTGRMMKKRRKKRKRDLRRRVYAVGRQMRDRKRGKEKKEK